MDEQELQSLFSGVPGEAPPPTFSAADVVTESKRQTVRIRSRIAVGGSAVILVAAGFGAFGVLSNVNLDLGPRAASDSGAVAHSQAGPGEGQPGPSQERPLVGGGSPNFSTTPPQQGGDGDGKTGPRAEGASGCEKVDGELAIALAGELPVHVTPATATVGDACSTAARSAGFPVPGGAISAAIYPHGVSVTATPPTSEGAVGVQRPTASGGTIVLYSKPDTDAQPPFAGELTQFAEDLARKF